MSGKWIFLSRYIATGKYISRITFVSHPRLSPAKADGYFYSVRDIDCWCTGQPGWKILVKDRVCGGTRPKAADWNVMEPPALATAAGDFWGQRVRGRWLAGGSNSIRSRYGGETCIVRGGVDVEEVGRRLLGFLGCDLLVVWWRKLRSKIFARWRSKWVFSSYNLFVFVVLFLTLNLHLSSFQVTKETFPLKGLFKY